jgi:hypothetical protein
VKQTCDCNSVNGSVTGIVVVVLVEGDGKLNCLFKCIKEVETHYVGLVILKEK